VIAARVDPAAQDHFAVDQRLVDEATIVRTHAKQLPLKSK
jgi:hypothetical protein